ncbi:DUF4112 domain-containing protein [Sphingomonas sp. R1]|uniref:DUF4112 domain-containing protein n=1 Tax=Sphingomonas sp. R1 TaxID=399176 RepID=UPI002224D7E9|nr:DUF4112 domain-containing protein [Sphingomonas sp. R1]UYY78914.1 DUF4112 domain-containing protein [Sphingomonas sp. R1]
MARATRMNEGFAQRLPIGTDAAAVRQRIEAMEHLLEGLVRIPGLRRKVGLDVLLDFVPGIGPTAAAAMGAYLAFEARNLGMPKRTVARMAGNIGIDWALGMIPFVGAVPDFFFRSNTRNLRLIKRYLDKHHPASRVIDA